MADIRNDFVGIKSPNPFWLASARVWVWCGKRKLLK